MLLNEVLIIKVYSVIAFNYLIVIEYLLSGVVLGVLDIVAKENKQLLHS